MANYDTLKNTLQSNIYSNLANFISGDRLRGVLQEFINTLGTGSNYMGILSEANKPTGSVDGKQFYIGFCPSGELSITVNLSAVGLGSIAIDRMSLLVVSNVSGSWTSVNIAQGITEWINTLGNAVTVIEKVSEDLFIHDVMAHGVALIARSDVAIQPGTLSAGVLYDYYVTYASGGAAIRHSDDGTPIYRTENLTSGDVVWVMPNGSAAAWQAALNNNPISLFFPEGCMYPGRALVGGPSVVENFVATPYLTVAQLQTLLTANEIYMQPWLINYYKNMEPTLENRALEFVGGIVDVVYSN